MGYIIFFVGILLLILTIWYTFVMATLWFSLDWDVLWAQDIEALYPFVAIIATTVWAIYFMVKGAKRNQINVLKQRIALEREFEAAMEGVEAQQHYLQNLIQTAHTSATQPPGQQQWAHNAGPQQFGQQHPTAQQQFGAHQHAPTMPVQQQFATPASPQAPAPQPPNPHVQG